MSDYNWHHRPRIPTYYITVIIMTLTKTSRLQRLLMRNHSSTISDLGHVSPLPSVNLLIRTSYQTLAFCSHDFVVHLEIRADLT